VTCTTDVTTAIGLIRLRINDRVCATATWSDEELQAFLNAEHGVLRASAAALEAMAALASSNSKSIQVMQLKIDTTKKVNDFLALARMYREQAILDDAALGGNFDWAEFVDDPFSERERMLKELQRET
jgi:predicted metal-dependent hydrolase